MTSPTNAPSRTTAEATPTDDGYSKAVPTKFLPTERRILSAAKRETGYSNAELIRRAVRLLGRQREIVNGYNFLLSLTPQTT